jgi:replicative DNA helicase
MNYEFGNMKSELTSPLPSPRGEGVKCVENYSFEAECAFLSAMFLGDDAVALGVELLTDNCFYKSAHRIIFKAMGEMFEDSVEIDIITLKEKLLEMGQLEKVGGMAYLNQLSDVVLDWVNIGVHARIVFELSRLRELQTACNQILHVCNQREMGVPEILDLAEQKVFSISDNFQKNSLEHISAITPEVKSDIASVFESNKHTIGVPTGFHALDRKFGGLRKGQLMILAARPGVGKSSFALNIAFNSAIYHGKKVAIFSMEMSKSELALRMVSSSASISLETLMTGNGASSDKLRLACEHADIVSKSMIFIDDNGSNSPADIKAKCRRLKAEHKGLDMVIIDYLQLMSTKKKNETRNQELSDISRALKVLAKDLEVPVIALSQLNRNLESRTDKRPNLADLRDSGAIEQDADIVLFIYRDEVHNKNSHKKGIAEIIVAKNRHGSPGTVEVGFRSEFTKFVNDTYMINNG